MAKPWLVEGMIAVCTIYNMQWQGTFVSITQIHGLHPQEEQRLPKHGNTPAGRLDPALYIVLTWKYIPVPSSLLCLNSGIHSLTTLQSTSTKRSSAIQEGRGTWKLGKGNRSFG